MLSMRELYEFEKKAAVDPQAAEVLADYCEDQGWLSEAETFRKQATLMAKAKFKVGQSVRWKFHPLRPFQVRKVIPDLRYAQPLYRIHDLQGVGFLALELDLRRPRSRTTYNPRHRYTKRKLY